jgi:hypothetical protein
VNRDSLKWAALAFALVATASAEYELARAVGYNQWVAAAVPGALDVWTVRAMRQHRDVLAAVLAMIVVNALSHLVTAGLLEVSVPLVVGVSAIAPLVLYRLHAITGTDEPQADTPPEEVTAPVTVERVRDDQPQPVIEVPRPLPAVVPAGVRTLPIVARPQPADVTTGGPLLRTYMDRVIDRYTPAAKPEKVVIPPPVQGALSGAAKGPDLNHKATTSVPAEQAREVVTEVIALTPSDLRRQARRLNRQLVAETNRPVTIDRLREEYGLSRREAAELRREVVITALFTGEGGQP